jgi:LAO/AO transport system kinase
MGLVDDALDGSIRALARLATHIENDDQIAVEALERLYPHSGKAHTIGVTGPPGTGKSTLVNALVGVLRSTGQTVAVIAIDPSSPLSGGATLGDRIRMLERQGDSGVFIRSTASRGRTGGLAPTTAGLIHLFDAVGFDVVIVETVGIGQEEIDIVGYVETVLLVQVPDFGDSVQSLKAGVLEVADLFVVNKADLPGAAAAAKMFRALLTLSPGTTGWIPPVLLASASMGTGIEETVKAIERHHRWLQETQQLGDRRRLFAGREISQQVQRLLSERLTQDRPSSITGEIVNNVAERRISPRRAAEQILANWSVAN